MTLTSKMLVPLSKGTGTAPKSVPRCPLRKSCASPSWERRAPARRRQPRWRVALPGKTLKHWWCLYETDI